MKSAALHRFRRKLQANEPVYGVWVTLEAAAVSEIATGLGFDWIVIDAARGHLIGPKSLNTYGPQLAARRSLWCGCPGQVRNSSSALRISVQTESLFREWRPPTSCGQSSTDQDPRAVLPAHPQRPTHGSPMPAL